MDRAALKTKAKELIKGNKWYIWKPMIMLTLVAFVIAFIGGFLDGLLGFMKEETVEVLGVKTTSYSLGPITSILSFVLSVFEAAFTVWYAKFLIDFTHGVKTEFSFKAIIEFFKKHWLLCWVVSLLVGLNIGIGFILLIVPGIWRTLDDFSSGSVCLCLASEYYDEEDYIRDYDEFLEYKRE